jgi:hypothetical protein
MGQWCGKYLDTGPPRGPGHYAEDGRWWWDDGQDRWSRVTDQEDVLEVGAEDVGGTSLAASLVTTLSRQYGNGHFRFVARARSAHLRWPSYAMAGATFPATRPSLEDVAAQGTWLETQRERFQELHQQLLGQLPAAGPGLGHPARRLPTDPEERMMRVLLARVVCRTRQAVCWFRSMIATGPRPFRACRDAWPSPCRNPSRAS